MSPIICPTITASTEQEYRQQMEKVARFIERVHLDLADGKFAPTKLISPQDAWWPVGIKADLHLMYEDPLAAAEIILEHKPNLVVVQAEAKGNFNEVLKLCKSLGVSVGVALLAKTKAETILPALDQIDHVLIFSGNLGYQGGSSADFSLLDKVAFLKSHKPNLEIGWDGGVNDQNTSRLIMGGVDVLNVGGYIQNSEDPQKAFQTLKRIADETGTT
jgi:ribulose-phosphate 3-epimerase